MCPDKLPAMGPNGGLERFQKETAGDKTAFPIFKAFFEGNYPEKDCDFDEV